MIFTAAKNTLIVHKDSILKTSTILSSFSDCSVPTTFRVSIGSARTTLLHREKLLIRQRVDKILMSQSMCLLLLYEIKVLSGSHYLVVSTG